MVVVVVVVRGSSSPWVVPPGVVAGLNTSSVVVLLEDAGKIYIYYMTFRPGLTKKITSPYGMTLTSMGLQSGKGTSSSLRLLLVWTTS